MEESLSKFVTAILAIIIMFIFPVYIAYEKKDDISYALAVRYTQDFVDKVRSKGYLTRELYQDYASRLLTTGNTYKIELEHRYVRFDSNSEAVGSEVSAVRNEEIYSTEHILNFMDNNEEHKYVMNVGDNFNVKIKNTNVTMATIIYNIVTVNMNKNNVRIHVDYGGKILADKWWGKIDFLPGGEDIDYKTIFSVVKAEAYTSLDDAKYERNAIKTNDQIVLESVEQYIFYKVSYAYKPQKITGIIYNGNNFREYTAEPVYTDGDGKYNVYKVRYGDMDVTTHVEFVAKYTSKYGEDINKTAISPTFSIVSPKVSAYASLDDAKRGINEILENENVVSLQGTKDIYYRLNLSRASRNLGVNVDIYRAGVLISSNTNIEIADNSSDEYIIYKVKYTNLPTDISGKIIANNYAAISFILGGGKTMTRNTVKFNFVYHNIGVKIGEITGNKVNIVGNRGTEEVRTTYSNNGYEASLQVKNSSNSYSDSTAGVTMSIETYPNEKNNGIVVKYILKNSTDSKKVARLSVDTDVYIDGDDRAHLYKEESNGKKNMIKMQKRTGNMTTFYVTINDFDNKNSSSRNTIWLEAYDSRKSNLWENSTSDSYTSGDSGFAFSWQDIEIPASGTVERSFSVSLQQ